MLCCGFPLDTVWRPWYSSVMNVRSGIYGIANKRDGRRYVGSTANLVQRWGQHRRALRAGTHCNPHLQRAWNLYGEDAFRFEIMEECAPEMLLAVEQRFLDELTPEYNIALVAGNAMGGRKLSAEHRAKIGAAHKGKKLAPAWRANISAGLMGKKRTPFSAEWRVKLGLANLGKKRPPFSAEWCANISAAAMGRTPWMKGKTHTVETRAKISAAAKRRYAK